MVDEREHFARIIEEDYVSREVPMLDELRRHARIARVHEPRELKAVRRARRQNLMKRIRAGTL